MTRTKRWRVLLVLVVAGIPLYSQVPVRPDSARITVSQDTSRGPILSAALKNDSLPASPSHSPLLAMGLSALLPGGGQVYNRSYWKVPVILGLGGYFVYVIFDNQRQYKSYHDLYQASLATFPGGDSRLLAIRDFYRDQRDTFGWYFLILYIVNIADAYVDASLFAFDVGDNLAFLGGGACPAVTIRFWLQ